MSVPDYVRARRERPERLPEQRLQGLEALARIGLDGPERHKNCTIAAAELVELLRVYRDAIRHDESDDVGPYDFFFR